MKRSIILAGVCAALLLSIPAYGQPPPPFNGGGTAFDPEPGVVMSGAGLDAQATVSADRRYVTITTGANYSRLQDLKLFAVQQTNFGFVGGLNPATGGAAPSAPAIANSPSEIANRASILNREGMFLLTPLP